MIGGIIIIVLAAIIVTALGLWISVKAFLWWDKFLDKEIK